MSAPNPTDKQSSKRRRRWYQFTLRGVLVFVTLIVLGLSAWRAYLEPYRQERRVMALVERLGGRYTAEPGGPAWLRRLFGEDGFQQITLIDVAGAKPTEYIDALVGLRRLETLVVGGDQFADEHLARLARVRSLRAIVLDSTEVTDEAIDALRTRSPRLLVLRSQRSDRARLATRFGGGGPLRLEDARARPDLRALLGDEHFVIVTVAHSAPRVANGDRELAVLQRLTTVRSLALNSGLPARNPVTDAGLEGLSRLPLQELGLSDTLVTDGGLAHLTRLTQLHSLDLTNNPQLTDAALQHVGQLPQLQSLDLTGTSVGGPGLRHLRRLTRLETLDLRQTLVSDTGLGHLPALTNLGTLYLRNTLVGDKGLAHLAPLTNLTWLDLSNTKVTGAGLRHLAQLPKLGEIDLWNCPVTDDGLEAVTAWGNCRSLNLSGALVTDDGVRALARHRAWRRLDLSRTGITNAALDALAGMPKLESLSVAATTIDDAGAAKLERIESLKSLECSGTRITAEGRARLKRALPKLTFR